MPHPAPPSSTAVTELGAPGKKWARRTKLLDLGSLLVSLCAAIVELIVLPATPNAFGDYVGLGVTLLGIAVTRNYVWFGRRNIRLRLWAGALLVILGPLAATFLGGDPLVTWTIAVFTAFSITVRGLPGLLVGAVIGSGVYLAVIYAEGAGYVNPIAFVAMAMAFTAAATGSAIRSYVRLQQEFERRALDALASREAEANQRVAEERLRIARDLHDLVGHEIAVLNMHLGVAEVNLPRDASVAQAALTSARDNVQSVLAETQRILHILRTSKNDDEADVTDDASAPAADFARIPDLVTAYRNAGVEVQSDLCAVPSGLDPEVSTAAYRVIQEALTNSRKHGAGPVSLVVAAARGILSITVTNAKSSRVSGPPERRGYGLVGMRERVSSAGGKLRINDAATTFTVEAEMRIDGSTL